VRARLAARAQDWRWSSVHALLDSARGDGLTDIAPVLERVPDFAPMVQSGEDEALSTLLRRSESAGRPLGDAALLDRIEATLGRDPKPGKRGPKAKDGETE
jgi:putative transposase